MIEEMKRIQPILHSPRYRDWLRRIDELEAGRIYCRHGLPHLLDVARIAALLAVERGAPYARDQIYAAALLHDLGRLEQYTTGAPHAQAGLPMARELLRETAFTAREQQQILHAIGRHRTGDAPDSLAQLLHEADHASRMCFACAAADTCYWPEARRNATVFL
ncbi:MAG TPA: HD domain-containing protein [Candidatus Butyricicoccus stercorigallinarum]|nr:HD domain-containing protein [Candidatus Butyricicoccus stercorigallinarum]